MARLIVPLDGSGLAERAVPIAAALARAGGDELEFVHAVDAPWDEARQYAVDLAAEERMEIEDRVQAFADTYGLAVTVSVRLGSAVRAILSGTRQKSCRAIVMATHGRSGLKRMILGSVAEQVLRAAPTPVFLLPARAPEVRPSWHPKRILVPLDGSTLSQSVLPLVAQVARDFDAEIVLLRAYPMPHDIMVDPERHLEIPLDIQVDETKSQAREDFAPLLAWLTREGIRGRAETVFGEPVGAVMSAIKRLKPDMMALATHGRSGLNRLVNGSVAEGILRRSPIPVMTLGPVALERLSKEFVEAAEAA